MKVGLGAKIDLDTRNIFIKIGAYILLVFGSLFSLAILLFGFATLLSLPEVSLQNKFIASGVIITVSIVFFLVAFGLFESMIELTVVGEKLLEEETGQEKEV